MVFTNAKESGLEALIVKWLVQQNGYEEGTNADHSKEYAIDETRLFRFLQDTQPSQMSKLDVFQSEQKKRQFLNRLQGELVKRGIVDVLRNGIKMYPKDQLTKQNVDDAVQQYKDDRDPREMLFQFKRCMVHLAVDDARIKFCTRLAGKDSWFLPFDKGYNDGAGDPLDPNIFLNLLIPKLPSPREDDLSQGILEAIDLESYRNEARESISIKLEDPDPEIAPVPSGKVGHIIEPEMDLLSVILSDFNDMFGNINWNDADNVRRQILEIPAMVSRDEKYQNAMKNSDEQRARYGTVQTVSG